MEEYLKPSWVIIKPLGADLMKIYSAEPQTPKQQLGLSAELRDAIDARNVLTTRTKSRILSDLDEINETYAEKERKLQRARAVNEILTSEVSYLNQLEIVKEYFMKPIRERGILSVDEFQILFGNIPTIYNVNSELLRELRKDPENVVEALSKLAPYFKLYSVYAYDYKKSLNILQNAPENNTEFSKFLTLQESRPEVQTKLSALLITPIQRIPRYCLLLKQVLDHTSPRHSSYSSIIGSLKKVEDAAKHINSLLEEQEHMQRLLELQRSLLNCFPSIIKPDRKLLKEGILMKMSQSGTHSYKRYFVLFSDILMCCKMKKSDPTLANSLKCSCILPLNKCRIDLLLSKGAFKIICQEETLVLHHEHADELREWVEALQNAIKKYINNRCTLRKDSSSRRPVFKQHLHEYQDLGVSPGKPRRKRKPENKDFDDVFKNIQNDSDDSDSGANVCFAIRATKRRPIRDYKHETSAPAKIPKHDDKKSRLQDSLFPLREHLLIGKSIVPTGKDNDPNQATVGTSSAISKQDVFVFGTNNQPNHRFSFNLSNIFSSVGNSFKKMFNFKSN